MRKERNVIYDEEGWKINLTELHVPEMELLTMEQMGYHFEPHWRVTSIRRKDPEDDKSPNMFPAIKIPEMFEGKKIMGIHLQKMYSGSYKTITRIDLPKTVNYAFGLSKLNEASWMVIDKETKGDFFLDRLPMELRRLDIPSGVMLRFLGVNNGLYCIRHLSYESFLNIYDTGYDFSREFAFKNNVDLAGYVAAHSVHDLLRSVRFGRNKHLAMNINWLKKELVT